MKSYPAVKALHLYELRRIIKNIAYVFSPFFAGLPRLKLRKSLCMAKKTGFKKGLYCNRYAINLTYFCPLFFFWNIVMSILR